MKTDGVSNDSNVLVAYALGFLCQKCDKARWRLDKGFEQPSFKGKLQSIREDIDSFEKKVVRDLEEIKCVLELIILTRLNKT